MRYLYTYYSSSIPTYFPINFFFQLLTSSKTAWTTTSIYAIGTGSPYSYWNMDPLFIFFLTRDTINNNNHFLTSIPESVVDATWVRCYPLPFYLWIWPATQFWFMMQHHLLPHDLTPSVFKLHGCQSEIYHVLSMTCPSQLLRPLLPWCIPVFFIPLARGKTNITHLAPRRELLGWGINCF